MRTPLSALVLLCVVNCAPASVAHRPATDDSSSAPPTKAEQDPAAEDPAAVSTEPDDAQAPLTLAAPDGVLAWAPQITTAAARHAIDPDLVALVVWLESQGVPDARSPAGAIGLMQLMPGTAAAVADRLGRPAPTEAQLLDPELNLELGCAHLAELRRALPVKALDPEGVHRMAVAYNGGPRVLDAWQRGEPLPDETQRYADTMRARWRSHLGHR